MYYTFQNLSFTNSIGNSLFGKSFGSTDKIEIMNLSKDTFLPPLWKLQLRQLPPPPLPPVKFLFFILDTRASQQQEIVFCSV